MLVGLFVALEEIARAHRALSMGSAILWGAMFSKKVVWRGDLRTMARTGAATWLAAGGAPVPNACKVGGSVVVRESGLKLPIAVSRQAGLTSPLPLSV